MARACRQGRDPARPRPSRLGLRLLDGAGRVPRLQPVLGLHDVLAGRLDLGVVVDVSRGRGGSEKVGAVELVGPEPLPQAGGDVVRHWRLYSRRLVVFIVFHLFFFFLLAGLLDIIVDDGEKFLPVDGPGRVYDGARRETVFLESLKQLVVRHFLD